MAVKRVLMGHARGFVVPALLVLGACGSESDGDGEDPGPPVEGIDLRADSNRDGLVDDLDQTGEDIWSNVAGAVFLANYDDDDQNMVRDNDDNFVNGEGDTYDLARVFVVPFADAPAGATGHIYVDALSMKHVRVFKKNPADGVWTQVGGTDGPCGAWVDQVGIGAAPIADANCPYQVQDIVLTEAEVKAGVELGVEGRRYAGVRSATSFDPTVNAEVPWSGVLTLDYKVLAGNGAPVSTEGQPTGVDRVQLRVAPWLMYGNLTPKHDMIQVSSFAGNEAFRNGLRAATDSTAGVVNLNEITCNDRWTEDWMITGYSSMPLAGGGVVGMRVAVPRPFFQGAPGFPKAFLAQVHQYPDSGWEQVYWIDDAGSSYDSGGNHDLLPGYVNGADSFPYGRIIHGMVDDPNTGFPEGILFETKNFYDAQLAQGPSLSVDTSWLIVGHVDEVFSYVPAMTDRGWKLYIGSPKLARSMLEGWSGDGNGATIMFEGKYWDVGAKADISIDDALADTDLMAESQLAQTKIDAMVATVQAAAGLAADEMIEIPYLIEEIPEYGGLIAYNPGTANMRIVNDTVVYPDPFGPAIDGEDGFKKDLIDRTGTPALGLGRDGQGLKVFFTDNWSTYHINLGEVHCGSNFEGPPDPSVKWWEAMQ